MTTLPPNIAFTEEVEESDIDASHLGSRAPLPGAGRVEWDSVKESVRQHLIRRGKIASAESEVEPITVLEMGRPATDDELPQAAKRLVTRAAGWTFTTLRSVARREDVVYVGDGEDHDAGDLRYPAEERTFLSLRANRGPIAFWVMYLTAKGKTAFKGAFHYDPILGKVFELKATQFAEWFDVMVPPAPSKKKAKAPAVATNEWSEV